jgi:NAD(P)-dependent dehydrogenase (short-subunit alcohol dehydrogenase family)
MAKILFTNVKEYTGPGALESLLRERHDTTFSEAAARAAFEEKHVCAHELSGQSPEAIHVEVGALIEFLASGKSSFTTGQVIHFSGSWP